MKALMPMNGGINKDVHPLLIDTARGEVLSRQNCRVHSADGGRVGVNVSIPSMVSVNANLPSGTNIFVGYAEDKEREIGVLFNYNSNGNDGIYLFTGNSVINLGVQNGVLNFNPEYLVDAAFIGDWCVFTDGLNPPRKVRVGNGSSRVASGSLSSVTSDSIQLARKHPVEAPEFSLGSDSSKKINKLVGKSFQFATYFVYNDYTYSVLSPYSKVAVSSSVFAASDDTFEDNYIGNFLNVTYNLGTSDVRSVVLLAREGNSGSWFEVEEYETNGETGNRTVSFYNDRAREFIPIDKALALYSDVPLKAKTAVAVQNRIGLANITKGYNREDGNVDFDVTVEYETASVNGTSIDHSSTIADIIDDEGITSTASYYYVRWTIPSSVSEGDVISLNLDFSFQSRNGGTIFYDMRAEYNYSYEVQSGDTVDDIMDAFRGDIIAKGTSGIIVAEFNNTGSPFVPVLQVQELAGGEMRMVFAGITATGYTNESHSYVESLSQETLPTGVNTYKSGSYYQVGVLFYDDRSRTAGVINPQRVYIPANGERDYADATQQGDGSDDTTTQVVRAKLKFDINDITVPSWATQMRFAVTESINYTSVFPFITGTTAGGNAYEIYEEGKRVIAILLPQNFQYEFANGDYVLLEKDNGTDTINTVVKSVIGTRTLITVDGGEKSGFWLLIPKGGDDLTHAKDIDDYLDRLAYIVRPKSEVEELIYYETPNTYYVSNGSIYDYDTDLKVLSGYIGEGDAWFVQRKFEYDQDGSGTLKSITKVVEDFYLSVNNGIRAWSRGRVLVEFDTQGQVALQDFVWSEPYLDNTKINGISFFSAINRKQLDEKDGQIQRIKLVGDVLKVIQDNKETSMYIGKKLISHADGTLSLVNTNEFIGTVYPMKTEYGTRFPLSIVKNNRDLYYWDNDRGQVIRSSPNGQIPISDYNMKSEFLRIKRDIDDALSVDSRSVVVLGHYDLKNDEFVITFDIRGAAESWVFKEGANVWTERRDYTDSSGNIVDCYGNLDTLTIGLKSGYVWKFESGTTYNVFFGDSKPLSITGLLNTYPNEEKCLRSLQTDSNRAANVIITSPVTSTRTVGQKTVLYPESFRLREGGYTSAVYSNILRAGGVEDLTLIHSGVYMTGRYFEITFEDDGATEFQLRLATAGFTINR